MPNPLDDIKTGAQVPLSVPQDDPELAKQMEAFINDANSEEKQANPEFDKPKVTIPPDDAHLQATPSDQLMTEALVDTTNVEISDMEKDAYIKALLNDTPFRSTVQLYDGRLSVELRSRSHLEQKRIFDVLILDQKENIFRDTDLAMFMTRSQEYCAVLMIERWNGQLFSELQLEPGSSLALDAKKLREAIAGKISGINTIRWTSMLNALRIFESKCAKLNTMAANADFWRPRATD